VAGLVPLLRQVGRVRSRRVEAVLYPGDVDRGLTYVHVDEVAAACIASRSELRGEARVGRLLIGEGAPVTYRDIHERSSLAFHAAVLPLLPVPMWLAWFGAAALGWLGDRIGIRRFLRPWMVQFAGEHFEFSLQETQEAIDWAPQHQLRDVLDDILDFAATHPELWLEINRARPW